MRTFINSSRSESRDGNGKPVNATPPSAEFPSPVTDEPISDCRRQSPEQPVSRILRDHDAKRPH